MRPQLLRALLRSHSTFLKRIMHHHPDRQSLMRTSPKVPSPLAPLAWISVAVQSIPVTHAVTVTPSDHTASRLVTRTTKCPCDAPQALANDEDEADSKKIDDLESASDNDALQINARTNCHTRSCYTDVMRDMTPYIT